MMTRTALMAAALGLVLSGVAIPTANARAHARTATAKAAKSGKKSARNTVGSCVKLKQRGGKDSPLTIAIENACARSFDCRVSWQLVCDGGEPVTHEHAFTLGGQGSEDFPGGEAACGETGFRMTAPTWRCEPATTIAEK